MHTTADNSAIILHGDLHVLDGAGAIAAVGMLLAAIENRAHGASLLLGNPARHRAFRAEAKLAAEAAADEFRMHRDLAGGKARCVGHGILLRHHRLRADPRLRAVLPHIRNGAVRFQTGVRLHLGCVGGFDNLDAFAFKNLLQLRFVGRFCLRNARVELHGICARLHHRVGGVQRLHCILQGILGFRDDAPHNTSGVTGLLPFLHLNADDAGEGPCLLHIGLDQQSLPEGETNGARVEHLRGILIGGVACRSRDLLPHVGAWQDLFHGVVRGGFAHATPPFLTHASTASKILL